MALTFDDHTTDIESISFGSLLFLLGQIFVRAIWFYQNKLQINSYYYLTNIFLKTKITCRLQLFCSHLLYTTNKNMKKIMEQVLQESAKVGHMNNLETTWATQEWTRGGCDLSLWGEKQIGGCYWKYWIINYTTYWKSSTRIVAHQNQTKNSTRTDVGPYREKLFGTMKPLQQVDKLMWLEKLIDFKGELMNCIGFRRRNLLMRYKVCNPQEWIFWMNKSSIGKFW
jgi:hypothetical protein